MKPQCDLPALDPDEPTDTQTDGCGRPPRRRRSGEKRSASPGGRRHRADDLVALVSAALDRPATVVEDGKRRRRSKREQIAQQLVERSAQADLQATKLLLDLMQKVKTEAPEGEALDEADEKVITTFLSRLGMAE